MFFRVHDVFATSRRGADEDHPAKHRRPILRDLLSDHPAQGESEDVAGHHAETVEESKRMCRHSLNRVGDVAGGRSDAGVVEQNDFSSRRQCVRDRRIPIVECPHEVLKAQEGASWPVAKAAVRIRLVLRVKELRARGDGAGSRCRG